MSVNYIDKSTGDLIRVAGQGKAEYGASTVRKGTFTGTDNGTGLINITVTFDSPMPDDDYLVDITDVSSLENFWVSVAAKTKNGFALYLRKSTGGSSITVNGTYTAFKLYTDTEYNNLLNNAVLTSDVTDSVTNGDMNPVTSNAVYDAMNTITSGTGTRNASYISNDSFLANWYKIGRICQVDIQFNTSQALTSNEEIITGLPAPIRQVALVGEGSDNDKAVGVVIKGNGAVRSHYQAPSGQFCHVSATYITAE